MPLYNILYSKKPEDEFSYNGEIEESQLNYYKDKFIKTAIDSNNIAVDAANEAIKLSLYNDNLSNDEQYNLINNDSYYQLHKVLNNDNIYSNEYYPLYENNDIESLIKLSGSTHSLKQIVGKFYIDNLNNLRLIFNPNNLIKENISEIYHSNFQLFYLNGAYYPIYFFIYSTKDDPTNIKLYYNNKYLESITSNGLVDISLNSIFGNNQSNISNDINNNEKFNKDYFIVQTLFSIGIYLNTDNGIYRYIPFIFTKKYFDIIFNKINVKHDGLFHLYSGAKEKNLIATKHSSRFYWLITYKEYSEGFKNGMPIAIENNSIEDILKDKKNISQRTLNNINSLQTLLTLSSNANYFNDLIFDIAKSGDTLTIPILLANG